MSKISVIVPCMNEEESLPLFYEEFDKVTAYNELTVKVGGKLEESKIYKASDGYFPTNRFE